MEIERREAVIDPREAAAEVPFGPFCSAWKQSLRKLETPTVADPRAELRSFSAVTTTPWQTQVVREGYVVVHSGSPGASFPSAWKDIDDAQPDHHHLKEESGDAQRHAQPGHQPLHGQPGHAPGQAQEATHSRGR